MTTSQPAFGSAEVLPPNPLRGPLDEHLEHLRKQYLARGWGERVGFGERPALIVIDLARYWLESHQKIGSDLNSVVEATCQVLAAARAAQIPIFFTSWDYDPSYPPSPHDRKLRMGDGPADASLFDLDPRLERRPDEKLIRKRYASSFKGTNLNEMLTGIGVDTLIVTGVSTSHCVYATCRDATDSFRVIVPEEAVGERCELMHKVNLLDIAIDLADVLPLAEVTGFLGGLGK